MLRIPILLAFIAVYAQASSHDGPMVAFMCNKPAMVFKDDAWTEDRETDCIKSPEQILEYCRSKFPEVQVTNVVKSSEKATIPNWCAFDKPKCHEHNKHDVYPYRCLVGAFQSDALLVPEHCLFDHKHGDTCLGDEHWNATAADACAKRDMRLESFAILQPCGVGVFNGVEFVCCPQRVPSTDVPSTSTSAVPSTTPELPKLVKIPEVMESKEQDGEQDEDFFAHYLTKSYDERYMNEHNYFMKAKADLQKHHHERVTKMMKEWAAARQRVQDMNDVDPKGAEKLNREITARFQKTYEALEEEGLAEKKQLQALHQQRVQSDLNDKKRHAMESYMNALTAPDADAMYILKTLKHYIKAEQKDRLHTVNHYKHEVDTDPKDALSLRPQALNHLRIIDERIEGAIEMLKRAPRQEKKIRTQIDEYLKTFHEIDVTISEVLVDQVDSPIMQENLERPVELAVPEKLEPVDSDDDANYEEYYDDEDEYDEEDEESDEYYDDDDEDDEEDSSEKDESSEEEKEEVVAAAVVEGIQREVTAWDDEVDEDEHALPSEPQILPAHVNVNKLQMQEPVKKGLDGSQKAAYNLSSYSLGMAVAGIAVFVILVAGIVVLRRKNGARAQQNHGFVEIDQATAAAASPEERHVANMQMNGYENPTYKYFESNA